MLNRQTAAKPTTKPAQEATSSNELPEILERRKQTGKGRKKQEKTG